MLRGISGIRKNKFLFFAFNLKSPNRKRFFIHLITDGLLSSVASPSSHSRDTMVL